MARQKPTELPFFLKGFLTAILLPISAWITWTSVFATAKGLRGLLSGIEPFPIPFTGIQMSPEITAASGIVLAALVFIIANLAKGKSMNALAIGAMFVAFSNVIGVTSNVVETRKESAKVSPVYQEKMKLAESEKEYGERLKPFNRLTDAQNANRRAMGYIEDAEAAADSIVPEAFEIDAELATMAGGDRSDFKKSTMTRGVYVGLLLDPINFMIWYVIIIFIWNIAPEPKAGLLTKAIGGTVEMSHNVIDGAVKSGSSATRAISDFVEGLFMIIESIAHIAKEIALWIKRVIKGKTPSPTSPGEGAKKNSDSGNSGDDRAARGRDTQRMKKAEKVRLANEWKGTKSQEEIAAKLGVDARTVRRYWNEKPVRSRDEGTPKFGRN